MIEIRENVKGNYKGYIYTSSIDEAKNIMEIVKKGLLSQNINFNKIEIKHGRVQNTMINMNYIKIFMMM